jgi:hypothetical protein
VSKTGLRQLGDVLCFDKGLGESIPCNEPSNHIKV